MHILLVEDDQKLADYIEQGLLNAGHTVDHIVDGGIALAASVTESYDVGIIDHLENAPQVRSIKTSGNKIQTIAL